jgi:hypothetical protein
MVKNKLILTNGINTRLFRNPGIDNVRRVINKFVNDTVVLTPEIKALIIAKSCAPKPVYFDFDEKGVIKVQPDIVKIEFEHLIKKSFFFFNLTKFNALYHKLLEYITISLLNQCHFGVKVKPLKLS